MKHVMAIWGLFFTAFSYGFLILIASLMDLNFPSYIDQVRNFSFGIRLLILAAVISPGLPGFIRAIRNTKKFVLALDNNCLNSGKDELAKMLMLYIAGFEWVCFLGFAAFFLGFPIIWSIVGLIIGTLCKLSYIPIFLKVNFSHF